MKTLIAAIALAGLAFAPAYAQDLEAPQTEQRMASDIVAADANLKGRIVQAEVLGMVCDFCAISLIKVIEKNETVDHVAISLETNRVTIFLKDGGVITDAEVEKAVIWAGYDLAGIDRA